jgi:hypothetical protein
MILRSYDAQRIASLANAPDALPWISHGVKLDWQAILDQADSNILVRDGETDAHLLFQFIAPELWEVHCVCPPDVRGKAAVRSCRAMLAWYDDAVALPLTA